VSKPKAHAVDRAKSRTYLAKADQFLASAGAAITDARHDAALLLAAADLLESIARGSDELHEQANQLRGLLKLKNLVEYEDRRTTGREAETGFKRAERLARWARTQVERSRS